MPIQIINGISTWVNYTWSNCQSSLGTHGNVILTNTTIGNLTASGLICTPMANISWFWPALILTLYVVILFLFGGFQPTMRDFTGTTAIMFMFVTVMAVMGFVGTTMWAGAVGLMVLTVLIMYFTNRA